MPWRPRRCLRGQVRSLLVWRADPPAPRMSIVHRRWCGRCRALGGRGRRSRGRGRRRSRSRPVMLGRSQACVVARSRLGVGQDFVGLLDELEERLGRVWVEVRMRDSRSCTMRTSDVRLGRVWAQPEHLVVGRPHQPIRHSSPPGNTRAGSMVMSCPSVGYSTPQRRLPLASCERLVRRFHPATAPPRTFDPSGANVHPGDAMSSTGRAEH